MTATRRTQRCPTSGVEVSLCECSEHRPSNRKYRDRDGKIRERPPVGHIAKLPRVCDSCKRRCATARLRDFGGRNERPRCDDCAERLEAKLEKRTG